eukprot:2230986-Pyramimonas_sp.AAC.3
MQLESSCIGPRGFRSHQGFCRVRFARRLPSPESLSLISSASHPPSSYNANVPTQRRGCKWLG